MLNSESPYSQCPINHEAPEAHASGSQPLGAPSLKGSQGSRGPQTKSSSMH